MGGGGGKRQKKTTKKDDKKERRDDKKERRDDKKERRGNRRGKQRRKKQEEEKQEGGEKRRGEKKEGGRKRRGGRKGGGEGKKGGRGGKKGGKGERRERGKGGSSCVHCTGYGASAVHGSSLVLCPLCVWDAAESHGGRKQSPPNPEGVTSAAARTIPSTSALPFSHSLGLASSRRVTPFSRVTGGHQPSRLLSNRLSGKTQAKSSLKALTFMPLRCEKLSRGIDLCSKGMNLRFRALTPVLKTASSLKPSRNEEGGGGKRGERTRHTCFDRVRCASAVS